MVNRLPVLSDKHKICIICEGNEEYEYLTKLKKLKVWNEQYDISLVNAGGNGNIPARYQDRYQNGAYELVLIFCDTEKKPHEQYADIKRKVNEVHGVEYAADEIIKSPAKSVNAPLIKRFTGVENYKGRADQLKAILEYVTAENYVDMCRRMISLESIDTVAGSSNFGRFMKLFENSDSGWIGKINDSIE